MMKPRMTLLACLATPVAAIAQPAPPATTTPVPPAVESVPAVVPPSELRSRPYFIRGTPIDNLPEYAVFADAGRYGRVSARATITAEGRLRDIAMDPSSGNPAVDAAIVRALQDWVLSAPINKTGAKVATTGRFPVTIGRHPQRIAGAEPQMPQAAKDAFHNGMVVVSYSIDSAGMPVDVKIARSAKSDLLDGAALAAISASRFEPPIGLDGKPMTLPAQSSYEFSQMDGEGSYFGTLKNLPCRIFAGEVDWWTAAHPDAKPSDMRFNAFMGGLSFIAPEALGWGQLGFTAVNARHKQAWESALRTCRAKPDSHFLDAYKKG